jgi:hypothetical protein
MSYRATFLDNQTVGVDDFNGIVGDFISQGGIFDKTDSYQLNEINDVTQGAICGGGIVPLCESGLKCTLSGDKVIISTGYAVFNSGVKFHVTEAETVNIDPEKVQYVYLFHNSEQNEAGIGVSDEAAEETASNFVVPLCKVENNVLSDMRKYARSNLGLPSDWNGVKVQDLITNFDDYTSGATGSEPKTTEIKLSDYNVGGAINFLLFVMKDGNQKIDEMVLLTEKRQGDNVSFYVTKKGSAVEELDSNTGCTIDNFSDRISGLKKEDGGYILTLKFYGTGTAKDNYKLILYSSTYGEAQK